MTFPAQGVREKARECIPRAFLIFTHYMEGGVIQDISIIPGSTTTKVPEFDTVVPDEEWLAMWTDENRQEQRAIVSGW